VIAALIVLEHILYRYATGFALGVELAVLKVCIMFATNAGHAAIHVCRLLD
jgi:hypothetical protein